MNLARLLLAILALILIGGGYAASQLAFFGGRSAEYARSIDQAPIAMLALVLLVGSIAIYSLSRSEVDS